MTDVSAGLIVKIFTERLSLRTPVVSDAAAFAGYRVKNRASHGWTEPPRGDEYFTIGYWKQALAPVADRAKDDTEYRFAAFLRDDPDQLVGLVNLYNVVRGPIQSALLGYSVDVDFMGQGYGTEGVSAVVKWAFNQADLMRLEANVLPHNHASVRVLQKCGFQRVGTTHKSLKLVSGWEDHDLYDQTNPAHRGTRP